MSTRSRTDLHCLRAFSATMVLALSYGASALASGGAGAIPAQGAARAITGVAITTALQPAFADGGPLPLTRIRPKLEFKSVELNVLVGERVLVRGRITPALKGRPVALQQRGARGWTTVATATTKSDGRFTLRRRYTKPTSARVRLLVKGDREAFTITRRLGRLNAFRLALASWYGGGGSLACGGELTSTTMGVANRTLPCGTPLTLRYRGRSVRVRVIDRGPYVQGREFDLTEATKRALGFGEVGEIWATG